MVKEAQDLARAQGLGDISPAPETIMRLLEFTHWSTPL